MRECRYIKCNKVVSGKRKKYCCDIHRVRQWEIDNNKPNFVKQPKNTHKAILKPTTPTKRYLPPRGHMIPKSILYSALAGIGAKVIGANKEQMFLSMLLGFVLGKKNQRPNTEISFLYTEPNEAKIQAIEDKYDSLESGKLVSSNEYKKAIIPSITMSEKYNYLFGNPAPNFYMIISGQAGSGKSTFATQFCDYFHINHGKAIYLASEQSGADLGLQQLIKRYNTTFDIHTKPKSLKEKELISLISKYKLVVFDSANHMNITYEQIEMLRDKLRDVAFVCILQNTKEGLFKGSNEWRHNCDIFIKCENLNAKSLKTRYGKLGEVPIIA